MLKKMITFAAVAGLVLALAPAARAEYGEWTMPMVTVGNLGNGPDTRYGGSYGAVDYFYNIGKYEVTAGQYTDFLNAVAATDIYGLYDTNMWSEDQGCKIERSGSGPYTYIVASDYANRPVNYVGWGDAARFANWLHNDRPTGTLTGDPLQDAGLTEDGAYYLNGAMSNGALYAVGREADWKWAIPTVDEWHKAAYHQNDGATGNYFDYPTSSDSPPSNDLVDPDPGNNSTFMIDLDPDPDDDTIGSPYWRTEVGAHENSGSPYGTFDQGGNVFEWYETPSRWGGKRGIRGGAYRPYWSVAASAQKADIVDYADYPNGTDFSPGLGFRVSEALGASFISAQSGRWDAGDVDTWAEGPGVAPAVYNPVIVNGGYTVTVDAGGGVGRSLLITDSGTVISRSH